MNTKTNNQFMFGLITLILGVGLAMVSAHNVQAESGSLVIGKSASSKTVVAKKMIQILPAQGTKAERMLMAQAADEAGTGTLAQIVDLQTAQENGEVSIKLRSSQGLEYTAFKLVDPLRLVLDFPNMEKGQLTEVMEVNQGVVNTIRPLYFEEAKVLRLEIGLNQAASYEILRPSSYVMDIRLKDSGTPAQEAEVPEEQAEQAEQAPVEVAMATAEPESQKAETDSRSGAALEDSCAKLLGGIGDSFSMDFQNANIKNIFRIIAEVSGFNLVLSPDVKGTVNVRLIDVPWNKAFELILENNMLGRLCEGNIIRIVPKATLLAAQVAEPLITEMIRVNYADITEMVKNLDGLKSDRGSISADVRTNTLIITDIPEKVEEMISVVKTLDVKTPQVMIEAKIVEVTRNYAQELGIKWGAFTERSNGGDNTFPAVIKTGGFNPVARATNPNERFTRSQDSQNFNQPFLTAADGFVPLDPGYNVDLGIPGNPTGVFGILLSTLDQDHVLDIQLEALEAQGKSRTIANPKVTTLDNKEAKIQSGTRFPVPTTSANEGTKITFVDANLELKVTPHITADENIYMKIKATQNNIVGTVAGGFPIIATKEAFTEVLVLNGATTVLGGLYQKTTAESRGSVPFFADIPFIGYLFKNRTESDDISELLIFVTPTIVRSDESFSNP